MQSIIFLVFIIRYRGGLDCKNGQTGKESVYTKYKGQEIMFHVSTLLPHDPTDRQQVSKIISKVDPLLHVCSLIPRPVREGPGMRLTTVPYMVDRKILFGSYLAYNGSIITLLQLSFYPIGGKETSHWQRYSTDSVPGPEHPLHSWLHTIPISSCSHRCAGRTTLYWQHRL